MLKCTSFIIKVQYIAEITSRDRTLKKKIRGSILVGEQILPESNPHNEAADSIIWRVTLKGLGCERRSSHLNVSIAIPYLYQLCACALW